MAAFEQAGMLRARQGINLPALLLVGLVHSMLLTGALPSFAVKEGASEKAAPSLQVTLLAPMQQSALPTPAVLIPETAPAVPLLPEKPPSAGSAAPLGGVSAYYPASALSRMPEIDGFFDVPVPPGLGLDGQVELRLWIDAAGTLDRIAVQSGTVPASYQQAAIAAFQRMRYRPGEIEGRPVAAFVDIVVEMSDSALPAGINSP